MANNASVYLAGPIQHAPDGGHGWRDMAVRTYPDFDWINPLDKYDGHANAVVVHNGTPPADTDPDAELVSVTELVESDKELIRRSDAVLVGWDDVPSAGTPMEVLYAYELNIPVVCQYDGDGISPWMEYHSEAVYPRFAGCVDHLSKLLPRGEINDE